jgi:hypothetical protein
VCQGWAAPCALSRLSATFKGGEFGNTNEALFDQDSASRVILDRMGLRVTKLERSFTGSLHFVLDVEHNPSLERGLRPPARLNFGAFSGVPARDL